MGDKLIQLAVNQSGTSLLFTGQGLPGHIFWNADYIGRKFEGDGTWRIMEGQSQWEIRLSFDKNSLENMKDGFGSRIYISRMDTPENKSSWYLFGWIEEEGGERFKFLKK